MTCAASSRGCLRPGDRAGTAELTGLTAAHGGWLAYDASHHNDTRRWWLEATNWSRLADANSVRVLALASMALQASDHRQREAIDLAAAALVRPDLQRHHA